MTQGDTVVIRVLINDIDGSVYEPAQGDTLRFAMKRNYTDEKPILVKDIPISTMELILNPIDTKNLDSGSAKGRYKYDIELTKADGSIDTVIPRADIIILEEVL